MKTFQAVEMSGLSFFFFEKDHTLQTVKKLRKN